MSDYSQTPLFEAEVEASEILESLGESPADTVTLGPQHAYLTAFSSAIAPDNDIRKLAKVFNQFDDFTKLSVHLRKMVGNKVKRTYFSDYSRGDRRAASNFITAVLYLQSDLSDRVVAKKYFYDNLEYFKSKENQRRKSLPDKHPLGWEPEFVYNLIDYIDTNRFEINVAAIVLKTKHNYGAHVVFDDKFITELSRKVISRQEYSDVVSFPPDYKKSAE